MVLAGESGPGPIDILKQACAPAGWRGLNDQINGGSMDGFAADIMTKPDPVLIVCPRSP